MKESSKERSKERTATPLWTLAESLATVCAMDLTVNKGRLLKEAKTLAGAGATAELVTEKYGPGGWWFLADWRGQKGEIPTPSTIRETWGRWEKQGNGGKPWQRRDLVGEVGRFKGKQSSKPPKPE